MINVLDVIGLRENYMTTGIPPSVIKIEIFRNIEDKSRYMGIYFDGPLPRQGEQEFIHHSDLGIPGIFVLLDNSKPHISISDWDTRSFCIENDDFGNYWTLKVHNTIVSLAIWKKEKNDMFLLFSSLYYREHIRNYDYKNEHMMPKYVNAHNIDWSKVGKENDYRWIKDIYKKPGFNFSKINFQKKRKEDSENVLLGFLAVGNVAFFVIPPLLGLFALIGMLKSCGS